MKEVDYTRTYTLIQRSIFARVRGSGILTELIGSFLLPRPREEVIARMYHGFRLRISPATHKGIERSLYYTGTYEKGTLQLLREILREGDLFIDIGANIGIMTIYGSLLVGESGEVIAFEANPDTKKILDENLSLNRVQNVESSSFAVGSERSQGNLYLNTHVERGAASLIRPEAGGASHPVEIIRLDAYGDLPHRKIRAIKIDIEGYELEALKGCGTILTGSRAPILILECSELRENFNATVWDLYHFIKGTNNYRIFRQKKGKERISKLVEITGPDQLPRHDNIYCFPEKELATIPLRTFA
ncbi:MAG: FkbM family methyltransferase [Bacteroidetes bacterium]|nr:MAG: FkbM family methyltransferase [Bacteroidota bacterium]